MTLAHLRTTQLQRILWVQELYWGHCPWWDYEVSIIFLPWSITRLTSLHAKKIGVSKMSVERHLTKVAVSLTNLYEQDPQDIDHCIFKNVCVHLQYIGPPDPRIAFSTWCDFILCYVFKVNIFIFCFGSRGESSYFLCDLECLCFSLYLMFPIITFSINKVSSVHNFNGLFCPLSISLEKTF